MVGLSLAEPMMIPTRGASTSISSKASSTSGSGSSSEGSLSVTSPVAAPRCGSSVSTIAAYPGTRSATRAAMSPRCWAPSKWILPTPS